MERKKEARRALEEKRDGRLGEERARPFLPSSQGARGARVGMRGRCWPHFGFWSCGEDEGASEEGREVRTRRAAGGGGLAEAGSREKWRELFRSPLDSVSIRLRAPAFLSSSSPPSSPLLPFFSLSFPSWEAFFSVGRVCLGCLSAEIPPSRLFSWGGGASPTRLGEFRSKERGETTRKRETRRDQAHPRVRPLARNRVCGVFATVSDLTPLGKLDSRKREKERVERGASERAMASKEW